MRILLLALMIILLPLRGWVGNAMAVEMAGHTVARTTVVTIMPAPMAADCTMPMQAADTSTATACHGCDTCQLCLALAPFSTDAIGANPAMPHASPLLAGTYFRSADRAVHTKPPIS